MSLAAQRQFDPKWQERRRFIAAMTPDEVRARLLVVEIDLELTKIDLELATACGRDMQQQLDAFRKAQRSEGR